MFKKYNWGILGCGIISNEFAQAMKNNGRKIYSVANRTFDNAVKFAKDFQIEKVYENVDDIFEDKDVDIVYIATPHNTHIEYLKKAISSKKHVLCEKAITLNVNELNEAVELAEKNNVILAEAMTIFHMPIYKKINQIISSGKLGKLKIMQINFGSYKEYNERNRFFNPNLAGGAMLDIGVYALSFARWFMSSKPNQILSQVKFSPTGVDDQSGILLKNSEDEMATITLSFRAKQPKRATVAFESAYVEFFEYPRGNEAIITYTSNGEKEIIKDGDSEKALFYEIQNMEDSVYKNENLMYINYTLDVMDMMTEIRSQWGMKYPEEK